MASPAQRYVDMWAFLGMHPTNLEILQRLKSADDRQFGTNMDVCGTVSQRDPRTGRWEKTGLAGLRSDIWNPDKTELKQTIDAMHARRKDLHRRKIKRSGSLSDKQQVLLDQRMGEDDLFALCADDIEKRRLVMKLFRTTGERMRWTGTIEEVTTREVHNSMGSNRSILSLTAILSGYEYLTLVQQNHRTLRVPSIFTFCFSKRRLTR